MFQRTVSTLLLFTFIFNIAGCLLLFKLDQWSIHESVESSIKKTIPENQLDVITVSNNRELKWDWDGKEFKYNGVMYDIVRSETVNGVTKYFCLNDKKETQLYANYNELLKKQTTDDKTPAGSSSKNLLKLFFSFIYLPAQSESFNADESDSIKSSVSFISITSGFQNKVTPPPKSVV